MVKGKRFLKYFERDGAEKDDNCLLEEEDTYGDDGDLFASIVPSAGGPVESFRNEVMSSTISLSENSGRGDNFENGSGRRRSASFQDVDNTFDTTFEAGSPPRHKTSAMPEKEKKKKGIKGLLGVSTHKTKAVSHCGEIVVNRHKLAAVKPKDDSALGAFPPQQKNGSSNAQPKSPPQPQSKADNKPRFQGMRLSQMLPGKAKPKLLMLDDGSFVQEGSVDDPIAGGGIDPFSGENGALSIGDGAAMYDDDDDDDYDPLSSLNDSPDVIPQFDPTKAHQVDLGNSSNRKKKTTRRSTRDRSPMKDGRSSTREKSPMKDSSRSSIRDKSPMKDGKSNRDKSPVRDDRKLSRVSSTGRKSRRDTVSKGMSSRKLLTSEGGERLDGAQSDRHRVTRRTDSSSDKKMRNSSRRSDDGEDADRRKRSEQLATSTHRMKGRRQYSKSDLGRSSEHGLRRRATGTKSDRHGGRRKLMAQRAMSEYDLVGASVGGSTSGSVGGRSNLKDKRRGDIATSLHSSKRPSSRHLGNKRTQMVKSRAHSEMHLMKDVFGNDRQPKRKPTVVKQYDVDSLVKTAIVATRKSMEKSDEVLKNPEELERLVLSILDDASSSPSKPIQGDSIHSVEEDGEDEEVAGMGNGDDALGEEEQDQEEPIPEEQDQEEHMETTIEKVSENPEEDANNGDYEIKNVISEDDENIDIIDEGDENNQGEDVGDEIVEEEKVVDEFNEEEEEVDNFNEGEDKIDKEDEDNIDEEDEDNIDEEDEDNIDEEDEDNIDEEDEVSIDEEDEDSIDEEDEENDENIDAIEEEEDTDDDEEDVIFEGDEEEYENQSDEENYGAGVDAIVEEDDEITVSMQYARTLMQLEDLESNPEKGTAGEKSALQDKLSKLQQQFAA